MKYKIIISGGGTGGHIYPAISIADALKEKHPESEILFVGAKGRMEMEKVPKAGYEILALPVIGLSRKLSFKIITFAWKLLVSLNKAGKIIKKFNPDFVVGVGGYASGPLLRKAAKKNIPCLIQEQNSYPGITNKLLAKTVDKICVAYPGLEKYFPSEKIIFTGNPVRQDILRVSEKDENAFTHFELDPNKKIVLVLGGSLGALSINKAVAKNLQKFENKNIQILWQTGRNGHDVAVNSVDEDDPDIKIHKFIYRMDYAYSVADIVITRAGASTISELCLVAKPCVFVPSPNVAEDHQKKNAMALVNENAAEIVENHEVDEKLGDSVLSLLDDNEKIEMLTKNIKKFAKKDAASDIADVLISLKSNT